MRARAASGAVWAMVVGVMAFALIALLVGIGATRDADLALISAAPALHGAVGDAIAVAVSCGLAGFVGLTLGTVALAGWLAWRRRVADAIMVVASMVAGLALMALLKALFERPRPEVFAWIDGASGFSFPSGHAFLNTVFWLLLAVVLGRSWGWVAGIALALCAGVFRVVAGVHWPSDVAAGWSLGSALVGLALLVRARFPRAAASAIDGAP